MDDMGKDYLNMKITIHPLKKENQPKSVRNSSINSVEWRNYLRSIPNLSIEKFQYFRERGFERIRP